jgi:hypothetical protein
VQSQDEPLLGQEEPLQQQLVASELGDPDLLPDQLGHEQPLDVVRVEMVALLLVGAHERVREQRVVGDVPVALVERGERPVAERRRHRLDDSRHVAAEVLEDRVGGAALRRAAERVADRRTGEAAARTVGERGHEGGGADGAPTLRASAVSVIRRQPSSSRRSASCSGRRG